MRRFLLLAYRNAGTAALLYIHSALVGVAPPLCRRAVQKSPVVFVQIGMIPASRYAEFYRVSASPGGPYG